MYKIDISAYSNTDHKNYGICREWALCRYFGINRNHHDNIDYIKGSDIELQDGRNISVKAGGFSLMSGTLCKGCKTFEGIWRRYYKNTHSNTWAYITEDWKCYMMNKKEFSKFIHLFSELSRESTKNGGYPKIRAKKENSNRIAWLEAQVS